MGKSARPVFGVGCLGRRGASVEKLNSWIDYVAADFIDGNLTAHAFDVLDQLLDAACQ